MNLAIILVFVHHAKGGRCEKANIDVLNTFHPMSQNEVDMIKAREECENYCFQKEHCWGCSVFCATLCMWNALSDCGEIQNTTGVLFENITQKPGLFDFKNIHATII